MSKHDDTVQYAKMNGLMRLRTSTSGMQHDAVAATPPVYEVCNRSSESFIREMAGEKDLAGLPSTAVRSRRYDTLRLF